MSGKYLGQAKNSKACCDSAGKLRLKISYMLANILWKTLVHKEAI